MPHQIEIPPRIKPQNDNGYFEEMTKAVFRAGFSWQVVREKWPNFQKAFEGFDINKVASYGYEDIDRLLHTSEIVRNGRKIVATIENARIFQSLAVEHGSFEKYLRSLDGLSYARKRKALARQFKNFGPTGVFVFLYSVNEDVPSWNDRNK
ncbi:MAG: DNA-3-methyladenine glycosylase I [Chloroflexi bacterium]|nr:DNA-3-methyladenine glycosylase I [Chloroflexota bacterium]